MSDNNYKEDSRYSRQSYSIGQDVMCKLSQASVLIIGYNITSQEIIKNLALLGINSISIYTKNNLDKYQKTGLYYSYENNLPLKDLKKLNPTININEINIFNDEELDLKILNKFKLIILTNGIINDGLELNKICNKLSIPFIMTGCYGLMCYLFSDLGKKFIVNDKDGEEYEKLIVEEINGKKIKFKDLHKLGEDDVLIIELNNNTTKEINVKSTLTPTSIQIIDELNFDISSIKNVIKKKIPLELNYNSLKINLTNPEFTIIDYSIPYNRSELLHKLHLTLSKYHEKFGELPRTWSLVDYELFKFLLQENNYGNKLDKEFITLSKKFCFTVKSEILAMASIIGGIVSQEVLKIFGHKFIPIKQWLYFDYYELFTDDDIELYNDCLNKNYKSINKYGGLINIFGKKLFNKIQNSVPFIIGSGAIGCELIKNLGMLGVKKIILTDNDHIEKSNLSRQFLFCDEDIGKSKSHVASNKIKLMNLDTNIITYDKKVCKETENIFNESFHSEIDIYLNALDNIDSRLYMDQQAIKYKKPLIDSGTMGSKGNVQVIIPYLTESYGSSKDPEEDSGIPICTIKSFPYKPEHTIQWARELFENEFITIPNLINKYKDKNEFLKIPDADKNIFLKQIYKYDCFVINYNSFYRLLSTIYYENFDKIIQELIDKYDDYENEEKLNKKLPNKIELNNGILFNFMEYGFKIINQLFGSNIEFHINKENINLSIIKNNYDVDELKIEECIKIVYNIINPLSTFKKIEFDKDNEDLAHIEWINECSNLRNKQYDIKNTSIYETRKIAGKIIPAMITTTSLIAGFQIMEYIKLIKFYEKDKYKNFNYKNEIDIYKNRFVNLDINYCDGINPMSPVIYKLNNNIPLTLWTSFDVSSDETELIIKEIYQKTNKKVEYMTWGNKTVYDGDDIIIDNINSSIEDILVLIEDVPLGLTIITK